MSSTYRVDIKSSWVDKPVNTTIVTLPYTTSHHDIVTSDCPKCGGNLPLRETDDKGICKCHFCGKEVYVW